MDTSEAAAKWLDMSWSFAADTLMTIDLISCVSRHRDRSHACETPQKERRNGVSAWKDNNNRLLGSCSREAGLGDDLHIRPTIIIFIHHCWQYIEKKTKKYLN